MSYVPTFPASDAEVIKFWKKKSFIGPVDVDELFLKAEIVDPFKYAVEQYFYFTFSVMK